METVDILGKVSTTPQYSKKHSAYTFRFEYQPKCISRALALARPPMLTITEFWVVVPEHLASQVETLKSGDTCVLVYPEKPQGNTPLYPVDILVK